MKNGFTFRWHFVLKLLIILEKMFPQIEGHVSRKPVLNLRQLLRERHFHALDDISIRAAMLY